MSSDFINIYKFHATIHGLSFLARIVWLRDRACPECIIPAHWICAQIFRCRPDVAESMVTKNPLRCGRKWTVQNHLHGPVKRVIGKLGTQCVIWKRSELSTGIHLAQVASHCETDDIHQISYSTLNQLTILRVTDFQRPAFESGIEKLNSVDTFEHLQIEYNLGRMGDC